MEVLPARQFGDFVLVSLKRIRLKVRRLMQGSMLSLSTFTASTRPRTVHVASTVGTSSPGTIYCHL
ncbi:hypothetical protein D3C72_1464490 [compost metagenome]